MTTTRATLIRYGINTAWAYLYRLHGPGMEPAAVAALNWEIHNAPRAARKAFWRTVQRHA